MGFAAIRPVGEPIPEPAAASLVVDEPIVLTGYRSEYLRSGTEALTLAVRAAISRSDADGRRRVLLPAYTCPDLVSAIVLAGGEAVLVDLAPGRPFMDRSRVEAELAGGGVAAIVVPHFLGMADDMGRWRELATATGVVLIEDSAQLFPARAGHAPSGDFVALSFGRGKPVNAGGGGALLARTPTDAAGGLGWPDIVAQAGSAVSDTANALKRTAFNIAIRPTAYGLMRRMPGLAIGETHYRPGREPMPMDLFTARVLCSAVAREPRAPGPAQRDFERAFRALPEGWIDLPHSIAQGEIPALLRYALLAPDHETRDRVLGRLDRFGASRFYGVALPDLPGMPPVESSGIDEARRFADRLLTLPVHSDVDEPAIKAIVAGVLSG
jgi:dTDP-4-amino-4,6-dideoxygalactose transaminase